MALYSADATEYAVVAGGLGGVELGLGRDGALGAGPPVQAEAHCATLGNLRLGAAARFNHRWYSASFGDFSATTVSVSPFAALQWTAGRTRHGPRISIGAHWTHAPIRTQGDFFGAVGELGYTV